MLLSLADARELVVGAVRGWRGRFPGGPAGAGGLPRLRVEGLSRAASAFLVAQVAKRLGRAALILCPSAEDAEEFCEDTGLFAGSQDGEDPSARRVCLLRSLEVPLYEPLSPPRPLLAERIGVLYKLLSGAAPLVCTTPEALVQKVIPRHRLAQAALCLAPGDEVGLEEVTHRLAEWGYQRVAEVEDCGEFAVRGGIVDFFPPDCEFPVRVEFSGDLVETLRQFDPVTQRSRRAIERAILLPVQEYPLSALASVESRRAVELRAAETGMPRRDRLKTIESWSNSIPLPGTEFLLPYLYGQELSSVLDYLPQDAIVWIDDPAKVENALREFERFAAERAEQCEREGKLFAPPELLFTRLPDLEALASRSPLVELSSFRTAEGEGALQVECSTLAEPSLQAGAREAHLASRMEALEEWLRQGRSVVLVVQDDAQAKRLKGILGGRGMVVFELSAGDLCSPLGPGLHMARGRLSAGFALAADSMVFVVDAEIVGERRKRAPKRRVSAAQLLSSMADLQPGDYVVHVDHGIGLYRGLSHLEVAGTEGDFLHLEYQGGDRLYIPVDRINLVQKYTSADGASPALDKLGSGNWERVKAKTRESIFAMARELIEVHAARTVLDKPGYRVPDGYYEEFAARFPFEETADQERAIDEVLADLAAGKPMDRLVCGDVGYGKTEVALRAAFVVVLEGAQVAVLVPTTVLARQHYETFRQRYRGYPVRIEMLSRLRSPAANREVLRDLARGEVDIVVGTHRLLQEDVVFKRLGLLVIDEEHRFGVADKERIKKLRRLVDVLTLTATPIPRTLHMALVGLRDLSVIETPPMDRLAVRTYVSRYDEGVIREAVLRELKRGGQVFFVHNRVETIEAQAARLKAVVPEASIAVAHGQMRSQTLEKVMLGFVEGRTNLLVCSAIIESGLDIPAANTIIINRADTFGLAQLYQLRGRVGRSHLRAYAYLLIPGEHLLGKEAQKRLVALQQLDELGGGFRLAAHDLEIRGAGNLLGRQQSGHIKAVGFELYTSMMADAVRAIRGEAAPVEVEPEMQLGIAAYIPAGYVEDVSQRLAIYKRLAAVGSREELERIRDELCDRFGKPPKMVETLLELMDLRRILRDHLVTVLKKRGDHLVMSFHPRAKLSTQNLLALIGEGAGNCKISPDQRISFLPRARGIEAMKEELSEILDRISQCQGD